MNKIKVMSFNLRYENEWDGINAFENRKPYILEVIREEAPDLIGFQEGTDNMRAWLGRELTEYVTLGIGRYADYHGEGTLIAFRRDRFEILSHRTVWLSPTPSVPASRYTNSDQSSCPRVYSETRLVAKDCHRIIRLLNIHTDHEGAFARMLEVKQMLTDMGDAEDDVLIFTGDFNALPDAPEIRYMTEGVPALGLKDASAELAPTFHGFGKGEKVKIDYIFTNVTYQDSKQIHKDPIRGVYVSDHDPICTTLLVE